MSRFTEQTTPPRVAGLNNGPGSGTSPGGLSFIEQVLKLATPDPFASPYSLAGILGRLGGNTNQNLWFNPDGSLGNGAPQILPNTALNGYGPDRWTFQQTGLNPFQTFSRVVMPEGDTAIFWMNGIAAAGANTFSTGPKTLTPVIAGANLVEGFDLEMVDADDISKKMFCTVTSWDGTTLVMNATSVSAGATGTRTNWVIGRNGRTTRGRTTIATTAPTPVGSDVLTVADSSLFEMGATLEYPYDADFQPTAGIQLGAYLVKRLSPTTIRMSKPAVQRPGAAAGTGILSGQALTTYGNQGGYGYQDIDILDIKSLRYGTALARTSAFEFDVMSNVGGLRASVMFLGYKAAPPFIGRAYVQSFEVPTTRSRVSVLIPGDTQSTDGTWIADGLEGKWGTLGFAVDSVGTPTSQNIPDGAWKDGPGPGLGIGGSDQQTFLLPEVVGMWIKITSVKWGLDRLSAYEAPTTLNGQYPTPFVRIRDRKLPRIVWENLGGGLNLKKWQAYVKAGVLGFGKLTDAEDGEIFTLALNPNGSVALGQYPAGGRIETRAGGLLAAVPNGALTPFVPGVSAGAGASTFGAASGAFIKDGGRMFVQVSVPVTAVGTGTGPAVADLPQKNGGRAYTLTGFDSQGTGKALIGKIFPNATTVQIFNIDGTSPLVANQTLNVDGWYEFG